MNRNVLKPVVVIFVFIAMLSSLVAPIILNSVYLLQYSLYVFLACSISLLYVFYSPAVDRYSVTFQQEKSLFVSWLVVTSVAIYTLSISAGRPFIFNLLISGAFTIIAVHILFQKPISHPKLIVAELCISVLVLLYSMNLSYPFFIEGTDPIAHVARINHILKVGEPVPWDHYQDFPLWHILVSLAYILTGERFGTDVLMYVIGGISYSFIIIISYSILRSIIENKRVSLLSVFILSTNFYFIHYGAHSIARSIVMVLLLLTILLAIITNVRKYALMATILITATVIWHPPTPVFVAVLFSIAAVTATILKYIWSIDYKIYTLKNNLFWSVIIFSTITVSYWSYVAGDLMQTLILQVYSVLIVETETGISQVTFGIPISYHVWFYSFIPILTLSCIGTILYVSDKKISIRSRFLILFGFILIWVAIPGPNILFEAFDSGFNIRRFGLYTYLFVSVPASFGLLHLKQIINNWMKLVIFTAIIFLSVIIIISSGPIGLDNNPVDPDESHYYMTNEELKSIETLASYRDSNIRSDRTTERVINEVLFDNGLQSDSLVYSTQGIKYDESEILFIRERAYEGGSLHMRSEKSGEEIRVHEFTEFQSDLRTSNKVYNSGDVTWHQ